jgi:hypothetical protein
MSRKSGSVERIRNGGGGSKKRSSGRHTRRTRHTRRHRKLKRGGGFLDSLRYYTGKDEYGNKTRGWFGNMFGRKSAESPPLPLSPTTNTTQMTKKMDIIT